MRTLGAAVLFVLLCLPKAGISQRSLGVDWQVPARPAKVRRNLITFSKAGITYLQIHQKLSDTTWQQIDSLGFTVWGMLPVKFPTLSSFSKKDSTHLRNMLHLARYYQKHTSVEAIGIFAYANENDPRLRKRIRHFATLVHHHSPIPLYYISAHAQGGFVDPLFDFYMVRINPFWGNFPSRAGGFLYHPFKNNEALPTKLNHALTNQRNPDVPLFFSSVWFINMIKKDHLFGQKLQLYIQTGEMPFSSSVPKHQVNSHGSLVVGLLVLLWILLGFTYHQNPLYRKSFFRYLMGHSFYVDDVMQGHIRDYAIGTSILLQHVICGSIVGYCFITTLFSPLGEEALTAHYTILRFWGHGDTTIFLWILLIILLTQILAMTWLWLANPQAVGLKQILNIYPWALQLNIMTATLTAFFYLSGMYPIFIDVTAALFVLIFAGAFVITSFDMAGYLRKKQYQYLSATLGLFILIMGGLTFWIAFSSRFLEVVRLALYLS